VEPFIVAISGEHVVGQTVSLTLTLPESNAEQHFQAELVLVNPGEELCWQARIGFAWLFRARHFFRLEAREATTTRFVHGADFSGKLLNTLLSRVTEATRGFVYMNQALKKRVESLNASRRSSVPSGRVRP